MRLDIPAGLGPRLPRAVLFLFVVFHEVLRKVQGDLLAHHVVAIAGSGAVLGHDYVLELHFYVFERLFPRPTHDNMARLDGLGRAAGQGQGGRRLVEGLADDDVVELDLGDAARGLRLLFDTEPERADVDLVLVLGVLGFALDAIELEKYIFGHGGFLRTVGPGQRVSYVVVARDANAAGRLGGVPRGASRAARLARHRLPLLVGLDVPAHLAGGLARAVGFLFLVFDLELGEVEGDVLGQEFAAVARVLDARDQDVFELDLDVLERFFAGLADGDQAFLDVLAIGAEQHESAGRLIDELGDGDIVDADFAGA